MIRDRRGVIRENRPCNDRGEEEVRVILVSRNRKRRERVSPL